MIDTRNIDRVNKVDSCYIPHASINDAIKGIERSILLSEGSKEPVNVVLTGQAGTGKTTACNAILSKRKKKFKTKNNCEVTIIPAFYSLIPSPVTTKGVASAMLSALGDSAPTRGNTLELTFRLGKLLDMCETKVILLDELQHLLKRDVQTRNDNVKDWLKSVINQFKVPVVIVGTPECAEIINTDTQLARRFTTRFELSNLEFGTNQKGEFRKFIEGLADTFIRVVKLNSFPDFNSRHISLAVYAATGGNPADTTKLFKNTVLNALDDNRNKVDLPDFESAYSNLILPNSLGVITPFSLSSDNLITAVNNVLKKGRR